MTDQEIIDVIKARQEGKIIEFSPKDSDAWVEDDDPCWNFGSYNYRVKPEPHLRAYKTPEEVIEASNLHKGYVRDKRGLNTITYRYLKKFTVMENGEIVYSFSGWNSTAVRDWESIHDKIEWADGAPFGVEEK